MPGAGGDNVGSDVGFGGVRERGDEPPEADVAGASLVTGGLLERAPAVANGGGRICWPERRRASVAHAGRG